MGIDEFINQSVQPLTAVVSSIVFFSVPILGVDVPLVVMWLVFAAV
jgi:AGCS family alanine or glycine:cation symporter